MNDSKSKKRLLIGIGVFLLVAGSAAAWFFRADPVDDVRRLRNQLFSEEGKKLSPEERKEGFQKLATDMKNLTPQQRKELFAERQKKISEDLDRFFKLSPEEQTAELDRKIDQMLAGKKAWENGGKGWPGGGKGLGGPGGKFGGVPGGGNGPAGNTPAGNNGQPGVAKGPVPKSASKPGKRLSISARPSFRPR